MVVLPKLIHHRYSGRLVHHRDTSYALLTFMLLGIGILLGSFTMSARASGECGVPATPQCSSSYVVTAVVPGPRPTQPATITSPSNGQSFGTNPVSVSGNCPEKTLVKIFSNGILVGSLFCGLNGHFTIPVDLLIGRNDLTALAFNTLDQEGPSSPTVTVTLTQTPGGIGYSNELILQSQNYYRGSLPGQVVIWPIELIGGQAPYAVSVDWGDGTSDLVTRLAPGPFTVSHTYQKSGSGYLGSYPLIVRSTDSVGHTAYLQLTTIVNASTGASTSGGAAKLNPALNIWLVWPFWVGLLLMVLSFWLGERREKRVMQRHFEALA
jgi:hypothetical protein